MLARFRQCCQASLLPILIGVVVTTLAVLNPLSCLIHCAAVQAQHDERMALVWCYADHAAAATMHVAPHMPHEHAAPQAAYAFVLVAFAGLVGATPYPFLAPIPAPYRLPLRRGPPTPPPR